MSTGRPSQEKKKEGHLREKKKKEHYSSICGNSYPKWVHQQKLLGSLLIYQFFQFLYHLQQ